jgi:streptomycin 6-kinase
VAQFDPPRALLAEVAERFRITLGPPLVHDGVGAWVAHVRRGTERYVLKLAHLHDESLHEADGLRAWAGDGTVRLFDEHRVGTTTALLLEECRPGTELRSEPPERQDEVLAGLLRRLWRRPPAGGPFRPLAQMCAQWADEAEEKGVPAEFRDGLDLFRTLPLDAPATCLLATDLHAGNILAAEREPWLVIDPKPYVGDPTYDALQHLLNNSDRLHADAKRWIERMARLLDLDPDRLRRWLYARCVQESPEQPDLLDVARRLRD